MVPAEPASCLGKETGTCAVDITGYYKTNGNFALKMANVCFRPVANRPWETLPKHNLASEL